MERDLYVLKSGEIWLKGGNRPFFERMLRRHLRRVLKDFKPDIIMQKGRFFLRVHNTDPLFVEETLSRTFGLVGYSRTWRTEKNIADIRDQALALFEQERSKRDIRTFKIASRRADKGFPMSSYQISCDLGSAVIEAYPEMKVDLYNPDLQISVEIRDKAYLYGSTNPSPGGLPTGSAGKGLLLLSGGIDSPVAGYLMGKRGLYLDALYFHAYPFTSDESLEKVKSLGAKLSRYFGGMRMAVASFTETQLHIRDRAPQNEHTLHMRYAMIETANQVAKRLHAGCLVTGESLSQVASQTLESLAFTNSASYLPVFRPLIGLDKEDIITLARKLDTYETSILPYDDCCTIFSPKRPLVKPDRELTIRSYESLGLAPFIQKAAKEALIIRV